MNILEDLRQSAATANAAAMSLADAYGKFDAIVEKWRANPVYPIPLSALAEITQTWHTRDSVVIYGNPRCLFDPSEAQNNTDDPELLQFWLDDLIEHLEIPVAHKFWSYDYDIHGEEFPQNFMQILEKKPAIGERVSYGDHEFIVVHCSTLMADHDPEDCRLWLVDPEYIDAAH